MYDGKPDDKSEADDDGGVTVGGGGGWELPPSATSNIARFALGMKLDDLASEQSEWSQATFGTDAERGPLGAIRHLRKETVEAEEAWLAVVKAQADGDPHAAMLAEKFGEEKADMLLLLLDLNRRSGGTPVDLVAAAQAKMKINRQRVYKKTPDGVPSEHVRGDESTVRLTAIRLAAGLFVRRALGWLNENGPAVVLVSSLLYLIGSLVFLLAR